MSEASIESGVLASGHPFARVGTGSRLVLSIPGLSFTHEPPSPKAIGRMWSSWRKPIDRYDLTFVEVGRRAEMPTGSTSIDVADDYASVVRERWGRAVGVMGISTGGGYAQWLAIRHPELVERLMLGYTGHRIPAAVIDEQRRAVDHFLAGEWRSGYSIFGGWFMPNHRRVAGAVFGLAGPILMGRPKDLRVLRIDHGADEGFDASGHISGIHCPTLVISGGRDTAYPPDLTRELVAGIEHARHIEYPKAGHGVGGPRFAEDVCVFFGSSEPAG